MSFQHDQDGLGGHNYFATSIPSPSAASVVGMPAIRAAGLNRCRRAQADGGGQVHAGAAALVLIRSIFYYSIYDIVRRGRRHYLAGRALADALIGNELVHLVSCCTAVATRTWWTRMDSVEIM